MNVLGWCIYIVWPRPICARKSESTKLGMQSLGPTQKRKWRKTETERCTSNRIQDRNIGNQVRWVRRNRRQLSFSLRSSKTGHFVVVDLSICQGQLKGEITGSYEWRWFCSNGCVKRLVHPGFHLLLAFGLHPMIVWHKPMWFPSLIVQPTPDHPRDSPGKSSDLYPSDTRLPLAKMLTGAAYWKRVSLP